VVRARQWFVRAVPEELRGRAMTVLSAGLMTVQGAGMALAGVAAQAVGVRAAVVGAGAVGVLCRCGLAVAARATEGRDGAAPHMTGR
jgi:predicted MFS family arabinose efflux permease